MPIVYGMVALTLAYLAATDRGLQRIFSCVVAIVAMACALIGAFAVAQANYTCEQAQLETYERRTIDGRQEQCMPDGRVWRLPFSSREVNPQ